MAEGTQRAAVIEPDEYFIVPSAFVIVTRLPVTDCQIGERTMAYPPSTLSQAGWGALSWTLNPS
jgi:hypothetical protein